MLHAVFATPLFGQSLGTGLHDRQRGRLPDRPGHIPQIDEGRASARPFSYVVGLQDLNRGPKDYEFANDTVAVGFIGLHEETVQYAKAQLNQYFSER